jgi:hypothetical protein
MLLYGLAALCVMQGVVMIADQLAVAYVLP